MSEIKAAHKALIDTLQRLALARDLEGVQEIVRVAARRLTGADGASLILRDGDSCYYVDEDAIGPLWKGKRFPLETCISGSTMLNRRPTVIEDVYADERIPHDAYRPTFVKSLAMVPIRSRDPIGAIGVYWAETHSASAEEIDLVQALADSTAVAIENVTIWSELEDRVRERTADLRELSEQRHRMLHTLSHEVRNPLTAAQMMLEELGGLNGSDADYGLEGAARDDARDAYRCIADALRIVDNQLDLAKLDSVGSILPTPDVVDIAELFGVLYAVGRVLRRSERVDLSVDAGEGLPELRTDEHLLTQILRNLLANALKFTEHGRVAISASYDPASEEISLAVADTGVGIAAEDLDEAFTEFGQVGELGRHHGTGLGLPLSRRLAGVLGGRLAVESKLGEGSTFTLTLPLTTPGAD